MIAAASGFRPEIHAASSEALIGTRHIDIAAFHGATASGAPATAAHWRRYGLLALGLAAGAWLVIHALSYFALRLQPWRVIYSDLASTNFTSSLRPSTWITPSRPSRLRALPFTSTLAPKSPFA